MAINYKLQRCNIKSNKNYGKYYAQAVHNDTMSQRELEERIESNCTAKASDVRVVLKELVETMRQALQAGRTVKIDELGSFSISLKSECVDSPEQFSERDHIRGFRCNFIPAGERRGNGDHTIQHTMTDGCDVHMLPRYTRE